MSKKCPESPANKLLSLVFVSVFDFLGLRGREAPGTHFRLFLPLWARRAQMTPVAGPENLKLLDIFRTFLPIWSLLCFGNPVQCTPITKHKEFWGPRPPPLEVLYVVLFPGISKGKEAPNIENFAGSAGVLGGGGGSGEVLYVYALFGFLTSVKVKRGRHKRGREEKRQKMSWQIGLLPLQQHFHRGPPHAPLPLMSSEVQKRGKLVREVRGPKDKTNGHERDALSWHFLSRPLPSVPFWPSPVKRCPENIDGSEESSQIFQEREMLLMPGFGWGNIKVHTVVSYFSE